MYRPSASGDTFPSYPDAVLEMRGCPRPEVAHLVHVHRHRHAAGGRIVQKHGASPQGRVKTVHPQGCIIEVAVQDEFRAELTLVGHFAHAEVVNAQNARFREPKLETRSHHRGVRAVKLETMPLPYAHAATLPAGLKRLSQSGGCKVRIAQQGHVRFLLRRFGRAGEEAEGVPLATLQSHDVKLLQSPFRAPLFLVGIDLNGPPAAGTTYGTNEPVRAAPPPVRRAVTIAPPVVGLVARAEVIGRHAVPSAGGLSGLASQHIDAAASKIVEETVTGCTV